ncbi:unnamed protein product [Phytophthora fragariaefolia]|uniref:Unnamed protein product n=1 Tax=Phytophthora fragariaefolia TaxID=1490495 RepID=A0A9W6TTK6_9STRA|nr:unnamed protein product [Phytophthora fragariaefolia]
MLDLFTQLDWAVNVYTMDHRGTGRSTLLDCVAAQSVTTGSPRGQDFDPAEVPACAQALENEYGNLASFSTTSAATDLVNFISKFTNGATTIVYGTSYGTTLVERMMHLDPPEVITGYVLDGIATTSGAPADKFEYFSTGDIAFGEVGGRFMALCSQDRTCSRHFKKPNTLPTTLRRLLADFDKNPNSTCASLMTTGKGMENLSPSHALSYTLGSMLMDSEVRKLIPPMVYRLKRCQTMDVNVLSQFITSFNGFSDEFGEDMAFYSPILYYLIVFSEGWERPQPSMMEMERRVKNSLISWSTALLVPLYCAFSKEKSKACNKFNYGNYEANGIIYERDEYWNKTAKIPSQASVLLLSSKLDAQTAHKYAEYLLETLDGDNKELITFSTLVHGVTSSTPLDSSKGWTPTCGIKILASYIGNKGKLKGLDKSCMDEIPSFNMTLSSDYQSYFGTDDVYDGALSASPSLQ